MSIGAKLTEAWQRFSGRTISLQTWIVPTLIGLGLAMRVAWLAAQSVKRPPLAEADRVARAFFQSGTLADAFRDGQGPTAHLAPLPPLIAGLVYRAFGYQSVVSETILAIWAVSLVFGTFYILYRCFGELSSPFASRVAALAVLCLLPLNYSLEILWFRLWDGAMATFFASLILYKILVYDRRAALGWKEIITVAVLAALLLFINPPAGVAGYIIAFVLMVRRLPARRWFGVGAISMVILGAVLTPWTVRNLVVMHQPIILRDNFGLELALANYQGAVDPPVVADEFRARWESIHPFKSKDAYARLVAAGGEAQYSRKLGAESEHWIAAHPISFARLTLRHLGQLLFPPAWQWAMSGDHPGTGVGLKMALHSIISVFGIAGLIFGVYRLGHRYTYAALMTLVPMIPYLIFQPTLRYRYLSVGLLVFFACDLFGRLRSEMRKREEGPMTQMNTG